MVVVLVEVKKKHLNLEVRSVITSAFSRCPDQQSAHNPLFNMCAVFNLQGMWRARNFTERHKIQNVPKLHCLLCITSSNDYGMLHSLRLGWISGLHTLIVTVFQILHFPFPSAVRQVPGYTLQRWGTVCTLRNYRTVLFHVLLVSIVLFYVLFVCNCILYYCHQVATQLQLTNISYYIIYHIITQLLRLQILN